MAQSLGDDWLLSTILGNLALAYATRAEWSAAETLLTTRLALATKLDDRRGQSQALGALAMIKEETGEWSGALALLEQRQVLVDALHDRAGQVSIWGQRGHLLVSLGHVQAAVEAYQQALALNRSADDRFLQGRLLNGLGIAYAAADPTAAEECFRAACDIAVEIGDVQTHCQSLINLGNVALLDQRPVEALASYTQALDQARRHQLDKTALDVLGDLASAHRALGEWERAQALFGDQIRLAQQLGNRLIEGTARWNISLLQAQQRRPLDARSSAEQALALLDAMESPLAATIRETLATPAALDGGGSVHES